MMFLLLLRCLTVLLAPGLCVCFSEASLLETTKNQRDTDCLRKTLMDLTSLDIHNNDESALNENLTEVKTKPENSKANILWKLGDQHLSVSFDDKSNRANACVLHEPNLDLLRIELNTNSTCANLADQLKEHVNSQTSHPSNQIQSGRACGGYDEKNDHQSNSGGRPRHMNKLQHDYNRHPHNCDYYQHDKYRSRKNHSDNRQDPGSSSHHSHHKPRSDKHQFVKNDLHNGSKSKSNIGTPNYFPGTIKNDNSIQNIYTFINIHVSSNMTNDDSDPFSGAIGKIGNMKGSERAAEDDNISMNVLMDGERFSCGPNSCKRNENGLELLFKQQGNYCLPVNEISFWDNSILFQNEYVIPYKEMKSILDEISKHPQEIELIVPGENQGPLFGYFENGSNVTEAVSKGATVLPNGMIIPFRTFITLLQFHKWIINTMFCKTDPCSRTPESPEVLHLLNGLIKADQVQVIFPNGFRASYYLCKTNFRRLSEESLADVKVDIFGYVFPLAKFVKELIYLNSTIDHKE